MKQICSLHIYIFNDISKDGKDIETAKKSNSFARLQLHF